ncbi:MAG TPA: carboxypeptidase regulatory-like domain-containing protein [Pyrinomonadaceae bacterium]|nr:carboxypeptidase regulatory-like domain-containing protein [Pyrinomonadaceae bacterium]
MKNKRLPRALIVISVLLFAIPLITVHGAGGRIEGKITDPKGAIVIGAAVTVTDTDTNQTYTAVTDKQGQFKVEGLPPGTYTVTVSSQGFSEAQRADLKIEEGAVANVDLKLELAPVEATVTVTAGEKPNSDPTYHKLREAARAAGDFAGPYATVNHLVLKRDAATFTLNSGEIYFAPPVNDRDVGAVFIGEGTLTLTPPTDVEKHNLSLFINETSIKEDFDRLVLRFTDKTFEEIKASAQAKMATGGPQAEHARELYRDNESLLRKTLRRNYELRTLVDLDNPNRPGFFTAFINGKRFNKLLFQYDSLGIPQVSPEEVLLSSYGDTDRGAWTAFHRADEYANGTASSNEDHRIYDITRHEIDAAIRGTRFVANDTVTLTAQDDGARVLPFSLFRSLRVSRVRDEAGHDLAFVQEAKDEDADFGVIFPKPLERGKTYKINFEYSGGDALIDVGGGNFFVNPGARLSWYPNNEGTAFGDRARFDVTFRYPKGKTLIGTGAPVEEAADGDLVAAKWSSGETQLAVAGFNYGIFKKKQVADPDTGYTLEYYANEDAMVRSNVGSMNTTGMSGKILADAENSTRIYNAYFGKLPFDRLALTQQPAGNFGQAWPTLVYMPFTAFMDSTQRYLIGGAGFASNNFFRYVAPHEIAHQWWGHMVGWKSYHDQWMSEGFAEFSASLFVQFAMKDDHKFIEFWRDQHDRITQAGPATHDLKPYTVGPVTQGYRLSSGKTYAAYQFLVYPKGAFILHMLRQMMWDAAGGGDKRFMAMMHDFIKSHYNQDVSTEDLKQTVEKFMTKQMDMDGNGKMDWFFNEYVYGTEMPSYKFEYELSDGGTTLNGHVTQSGVSDNFKMLVPVYVDEGKGMMMLGQARILGNKTIDLKNIKLPRPVKRAAICAYQDVLALNIQNEK